jgi:DNA primase
VAEHILSELPEEDLIDNEAIVKFIHTYKQALADHIKPEKNHFLYHSDPVISTLAVALVYFPYEESVHWKRELSNTSGYQTSLFKQDYRSFLETIRPENEEKLLNYLKMQKDTTNEEVESAINYIKLRKIKRLILQNQADLEKAAPEEQQNLILTDMHLKQMEIDLTRKLGSVVIK